MTDSSPSWPRREPEPIFNVAPAVVGLAGALLAIHVIREWVLSGASDLWLIVAFAFIPAREFAEGSLAALPGGDAARFWSPLTYALLHADWTHVLVNDLWLVAFGSPLAWRFGTVRFLVFSAVGAIAGALLHLAFYPGDAIPMVGASAAISAHMAAVSRFAFVPGAPIFGGRGSLYRSPAPPLAETIRNPRVLAFIGVWFGVNLLFGITGLASGVVSGAIAWDAHLGGFAAGLVLFSLFDRE